MNNGSSQARSGADAGRGEVASARRCFHCGTPCHAGLFASGDHAFCCRGCQTVFELLTENGLADFYNLADNAGVRVNAAPDAQPYRHLDVPAVRERLVDFADDRTTRVTFRLPAIHCIACVWLLENLFRLNPGIGQSRVNFPRKEISLGFENARVKLSEIAALLASLGYEPELKLSDLGPRSATPANRRLWLQLGVAGFAFGNIMLFSISSYLGLDSLTGPVLRQIFGWTSLLLAIPVVLYSASDYWRSAWQSLRRRVLTIDVPVAIGIAALFTQSCFEVASGRGVGYLDSLSGLVFFLLCGRWFQQKTYDRLAFDRDYKSFFPLSITRLGADGPGQTSLSELRVGDRLLIRNGELIPADARLTSGPALIDYSFVTGESEPAERRSGDRLYAGGRQVGGAIEVETLKPVSQSYLTSLWNQDAFRKERCTTLDTLTNRYSRRFTAIVIAVAVGAAVFWSFRDPARAVRSFTSVLIVACPCALALAAPFALGTAQRVLGPRGVFLKNPGVLETLARVDAVVFDKTGTLTAAGAGATAFHGVPLGEDEQLWIRSMARHSTHPHAARVAGALGREPAAEPVHSFRETPGCGMEGHVAGREIWMGSAAWLASRNVPPHAASARKGGVVHVAIDGKHRGCFVLTSAVRPETEELIRGLAAHHELALLSGDNEKERGAFAGMFGSPARLRFNQSPVNKLGFIRELQASGRTVMMVGDGLNDAGALRQSDAGVAVVETLHAFSPASDVIIAAAMVPRLHRLLRFAKSSVRIVRASFVISSLYNVVGISFAARGILSPVVCAILMPLSSITVVAFACGMTAWAGTRAGLAAAPDSAAATSVRPKAAATRNSPDAALAVPVIPEVAA
jgi:Cu+-exporting ATPase